MKSCLLGSSTEITALKFLVLKICLHICSSSDLDPFLSAIWRGDAKALQDLINFKSKNLDEPNKDGWLPLHESAYYGHVECLKILLKGDEWIHFLMSSPESHSQKSQLYSISPTAKPDTINKQTNKSQTPLILAVNHKRVSGVKHLLEEGADPNLANYQWETPLYKGTHFSMISLNN